MEELKSEMIRLELLGTSEHNARRKLTQDPDQDELTASIHTHGILSSLVVRKITRPKAKGPKYAVVAGERRLTGLRALADAGKIDPKTYEVPCRVRTAASAKEIKDLEISLAENSQRTEMDAVDKYEAFRTLTEEGVGVGDIATRFGITTRGVEQCLRLADVHEDILEAARLGKVTTEVLMAFAANADKSRQLKVWQDARDHYGQPHAGWVRNEMLREHMVATHARVRFIGLDAYTAAGGRTEHDLFATTDDDIYLSDLNIVDELAKTRLEAIKKQVKDDWGWVETAFDVRYSDTEKYGRIEGRPGALTTEEETRYTEIGDEIGAIEAELTKRGDGSDNVYDELDEGNETEEPEGDNASDLSGETVDLHGQLHTLRHKRRRIQDMREQRAIYDAGQMKHAGVILTIDPDGQLYRHAGLVREQDALQMPAVGEAERHANEAAAEAAKDAAPEPEASATTGEPAENLPTPATTDRPSEKTAQPSNGGPRPTGAAPRGAPAEPAPTPDNYRPPTRYRTPEDKEREARNASGLGTALFEDMQVVRNSLIKAELAGNFEVAFDLATYHLAVSVLTSLMYSKTGLTINASETPRKTYHGDEDRNRAVFGPSDSVLETLRERLTLDWLDNDNAEKRFSAFCALDARQKQEIFATAVSWTLGGQLAFEPERKIEVEMVAERLNVPFATGFRPTAANFWGRVSKGDAMAAATAILGPDWVNGHSKDKKAELANALELAFAAGERPVDLTKDQHEAANAWTAPGFQPFDTRGLDPKVNVQTEKRGTVRNGFETAQEDATQERDNDKDPVEETEDAATAVEAIPQDGNNDDDDGFDRAPATTVPAFLQK